MYDDIDEAERLRRIRRALETMPRRHYEVFVRLTPRTKTYPQIAAELGISVRRVERRFAAALVHISRYVDGDAGV